MAVQQVLPNIDLSQYVGEWVVICRDKVVAHHKNITKLDEAIKKCKTPPTIAKIPRQDICIF